MSNYRIPSDYVNDTPRANHNWRAESYGTIHPGVAIPVKWRHLNAKDRYRADPQVLIQSQPLHGPLLHGFKYITICTFMPDSFIYGWMRSGSRYTPKQYTEFERFTFCPFEVGGTYTDPTYGPSGGTKISYKGLIPGVRSYKTWVSDIPIDDSGYTLDHVGRGGLWDWLGVPAGTVVPRWAPAGVVPVDGKQLGPSMNWRVEPVLCYLLSHYYYIANMQEDYMYFTRSVFDRYMPDGTPILNDSFHNTLIGFDFATIISSLLQLNLISSFPVYTGTDLSSLDDSLKCLMCNGLGGYGGLLSVPYQPDLFNNIIKAGESPTAYIEVEQQDGKDVVAVPRLRLQTKVQNMLDRMFVSGGRFEDLLRTLFGTKGSPTVNKPEFLGAWQASIDPTNVVSQAPGAGSDGTVDLGQMAARVDRFSSFKGSQGVDYYAKEPGTIMFISMLVPEPAYFQGLNPDLVGMTFADDFNPEMNGIGFQAVPRHRYSTLPVGTLPQKPYESSVSVLSSPWVQTAPIANADPNLVEVGEEVAWSWLRTDYPTLHGEFAENGFWQYWTLARRYSYYGPKAVVSGDVPEDEREYYGSENFTTYINPLDWQYIFTARTQMDANFMLYASFDATVTSSLSKNYMPYLGK